MPCRNARLAAALLAACGAAAQATTVALGPDGLWTEFNVSQLDSQTFGLEWVDLGDSLSPDFGSPLTFTFVVAAGQVATLTVVDAGFAGDTFDVTNHGATLGATSAVPVNDYEDGEASELDFDAALANPAYSRGVFTLGAGSYAIGGLLGQSVLVGGEPLNATLGGIRLEVSAVPEPASWAMLLGGMGLLGVASLRRR